MCPFRGVVSVAIDRDLAAHPTRASTLRAKGYDEREVKNKVH